MKAIRLFVLALGLFALSMNYTSNPQISTARAADESISRTQLDQVEVTWDPQLQHPSFLRGPMPFPDGVQSAQIDRASAARAFLENHSTMLGINNVQRELVATQVTTDQVGFSHVTLQQVYAGVAVYQAQIKVHMNAAANEVVALSNGFIPDIALATVQPQIEAETVVAAAHKLLPQAIRQQEPTLVIYPGTGSGRAATPARLAWLVELFDTSQPTRAIYVFDANSGELIDVLNRLYQAAADQPANGTIPPPPPNSTGATRLATYSAHNTATTPGELMRIDDALPVGDADTDKAHDFAQNVYDYYQTVHQRNSYDDQGGVITSTVHYGDNMPNAFWTGKQMIYGDGFPALDIVGHELTHAVIFHTANLEYRWQAGALNESLADIFGAMVDREDWLIGEDLAEQLGQAAIRDMAIPERFNQPSHTANWMKTCSDEEGVHINSGIFNKAYYNIATALGLEKAERIFYRALVTYFTPTTSFADARAAVLQATDDLYTSAEHDAVINSFDAVGLSSSWQPPINDCECSIGTSLDPQAAATVSDALYQVRDTHLASTDIGRYYKDLYYEHTAQISLLLLAKPALRAQAAHLLQLSNPGFQQLGIGSGDPVVVTAEMVTRLHRFVADLAQAATAIGDDDLAQTLAREQARIDWSQLPGMHFDQAWAYLNTLSGPYTIYLPTIQESSAR